MIVTMLGRSYQPGYTGLGSDDPDWLKALVGLGEKAIDTIPDIVSARSGNEAVVPVTSQTSWVAQNRELVTVSAIVLGVVVVSGVLIKKKRRR
jgi:hypothetical protein